MSAVESPRRALLGRARHRWMITRTLAAWWPIPAASLVAVLAPWPITAGLVCWAVAIRIRWPGRLTRPLRAAWWRTRWWFDARAAGLVVVADPSINAIHERGGRQAVGIEIAPRIRRIRFGEHGRTLEVRTVPGQTPDDFARARTPLSHRWGCNVSTLPHPTRRRVIIIKAVDPRVLDQTVTHPNA